jgi:hypothetical protein
VPLSKPHPGAPTVLIDEIDACAFKGPANSQIIRYGHGRFVFSALSTPNRSESQSGLSRKVLGAPPQ